MIAAHALSGGTVMGPDDSHGDSQDDDYEYVDAMVAMLPDGRIIWSGPTSQLDEAGSAHVHQFVNQLAEGPIKMRVRAA